MEKDKSHLKIAKSFSDESYLYRIILNVQFDPNTNNSDFIFRNSPDYIDYKLNRYPAEKERDLHALFKLGEVKDYSLYRNGTRLSIHLKNEEDYFIATAAILQNNSYTVDFARFPKAETKRKLKKKVKFIQDVFNKAGMEGAVTFLCDHERQMVRAHTKNGYDFVRLFGLSRELQQNFSL